MTKPFLALGFAGPHLVELTTSAALLARWDALPVAFSMLGIDRIDGSPPAPLTLAASAVGANALRCDEAGTLSHRGVAAARPSLQPRSPCRFAGASVARPQRRRHRHA